MKNTQKMKILAHLQKHGSITPKEAEAMFGCMRLAARIADLKAMGYAIESRRRVGTGKDGPVVIFAEYYLIKEESNA